MPASIEVNSVEHVDLQSLELTADADPDLCGLAEALPGENVCSLLCDPDAFAARLVDDGMQDGRCYNFRCELPGGTVATVGVCLP